MAIPRCSFCDEQEAVYMGTSFADGNTQTPCGSCLPGYAFGMALGILTSMPADTAAAYADVLAQIHASDPSAPAAPAPKTRTKRQATPAADAAPDEPQTPLSVPVTLPEPCSDCGTTTGTGDDSKLTCDGCGKVLATVDESELSGAS